MREERQGGSGEELCYPRTRERFREKGSEKKKRLGNAAHLKKKGAGGKSYHSARGTVILLKGN